MKATHLARKLFLVLQQLNDLLTRAKNNALLNLKLCFCGFFLSAPFNQQRRLRVRIVISNQKGGKVQLSPGSRERRANFATPTPAVSKA
jgi:hypothetical protein